MNINGFFEEIIVEKCGVEGSAGIKLFDLSAIF